METKTFDAELMALRQHMPEYLQRRGVDIRKAGNNNTVCPVCNGGYNTPCFHYYSDTQKVHCFSCQFDGDIFDLVAKERGISNKEAIAAVKQEYGGIVAPSASQREQPIKESNSGADPKAVLSFVIKCKERIEGAASYLQARGISMETAKARDIGYNAAADSVIIPFFGYSDGALGYTERAQNGRYYNHGGTGVFNPFALEQEKPVFIVEGAFDALSVIEAGGQAVALNSVSNAGKFAKMLATLQQQERLKPQHYFIAMDNDEAGKRANEELRAMLEGLKLPCSVVNIAGNYKDANEALSGDKAAFRANIEQLSADPRKEALAEIEAHKVGSLLPLFSEFVKDTTNNKPIPTGFKAFDTAIGGGLLPKFYIIGAVSSLGKTTFVMQMADNVAKAGNDVIIFSLEMAKEDIIARSISRHTYERTMSDLERVKLAKTELGIVTGTRYKDYSPEEKELIAQAYKDYAAYASDHISIYEGKHTADEIREIVKRHILFTGNRPVVIVDYLQIVQPAEAVKKATIREQTDYTIDVFSAMRRELKTPVIGISSFNRNSYTAVADNSSFKESGTIEYTGDCVITLELDYVRETKGTDKENTNKERAKEAMRKTPREIKLTFQKNRGNKVGTVLYFLYNPLFSHFELDPMKEHIL